MGSTCGTARLRMQRLRQLTSPSTLGSKLICFQIGNEPDYDHDAGSKEHWTFDHYWERWQTFQAAVKQAVPSAHFAGPDVTQRSIAG